MALTQLADIIEPTVWQDTPSVNSPERTAIYEGGIIVRSALIDALASATGSTAELPFWNDLDETSAPNISDDTENSSTPGKVAQGKMISRKLFLNKSWKSADLVNEMALGPKAMDQIKARTDKYWMRQWQRYLLAAADGVLADNVANDSGDMVYDIASESVAGQGAGTKWSRAAFTASAFTLGDAYESTTAIAVHSSIYQQMVDADDIDFIPDSQGRMSIPTFMGRRIIVDDSTTITAGSTDGFKYTTVLFGEGAFGWGKGSPTVPVEVERKASEGNGGGTEILHTRETHLIHPFGFQFISGSVAGESATLAETRLAANWNRVVARKNVPLAYLITN